MSDYKFTKDWFHWAPELWTQLIPLLPTDTERSFLEIGSFEGRSMVWIAENMMRAGDELICIDTWGGGEEHGEEDMAAVEARFDHNCLLVTSRKAVSVIKRKMTSTKYLGGAIGLAEHGIRFDFIYIDGSHIAKDVLTDACMAWPLLKSGGIMVFDDYTWGTARDILHRPKPAVDAFVNIFSEHLDIVHMGYQFVVRKK